MEAATQEKAAPQSPQEKAETEPKNTQQSPESKAADQAETPKTAEATPKKSETIYLIQLTRDGKVFDLAVDDNGKPLEFAVMGGQKEARRRYVEQDPTVIEQLVSQGKVYIAAIPKASFQPTEVRVERPQPRIIA